MLGVLEERGDRSVSFAPLLRKNLATLSVRYSHSIIAMPGSTYSTPCAALERARSLRNRPKTLQMAVSTGHLPNSMVSILFGRIQSGQKSNIRPLHVAGI
jgi:hypothetical protein